MVDVGRDGEALWRAAFWVALDTSVAVDVAVVKSYITLTPPGRSWVGYFFFLIATFKGKLVGLFCLVL